MKRTLRLLAAPAAAILLLASCGTSDEPAPAEDTAAQEAPQADGEAAEDEQADDSDSWPIVEDEDGNVVENPEDQPMDDGGDDTYEPLPGDIVDDEGNLVGIEFGDDEKIEFDIDATDGATPTAPGTRYYGASENGGDFIISTQIEPVANLEALREEVDEEPVSYMSVDVDNRDGVESINMYQVAVYDAAGNEYLFSGPDEIINQWRERLPEDEQYTGDWVDVSNSYINQGASAHQRTTMILAGPELPEDIVAVIAMPSGVFETTTTVPLKN